MESFNQCVAGRSIESWRCHDVPGQSLLATFLGLIIIEIVVVFIATIPTETPHPTGPMVGNNKFNTRTFEGSKVVINQKVLRYC